MTTQTNPYTYDGLTKQQIVSAIRKEWMSYSKKFAAIQKHAERVLLDNGRWKTLIRCACCGELFDRSDIQANHINPVGALVSTAPANIAAYRQRMFCKVAEIEPLCIQCHRRTTTNQRKQPLLH
jgi:hypothetical protein